MSHRGRLAYRWKAQLLQGKISLANRLLGFPDWLEGNADLTALLLTACVFTFGLVKAVSNPLWFDEIFTLYLAKLGDFRSMIQAVYNATDTIPPLFHWLESWPLRLFGRNQELGLRFLPAVGVAATVGGLYLLLRKNCSRVAALAGSLLPTTTLAIRFSWEARPYGLILGFYTMAALAWQRAEQTGWAVFWLSATLSLAAALHPFTIFVIAAFATAEAISSWRHGRIRWRVITALSVAVLFFSLQIPFLRSAHAVYSENYWADAGISEMRNGIGALFSDWNFLMPAILLWFGISGICTRHSNGPEPVFRKDGPAYPGENADRTFDDACLGLSLLVVYPGALWIACRLFGGGIAHRYLLPVSLGAAILLGITLDRLAKKHAAAIAAIMAGFFLVGAGTAGLLLLRSFGRRAPVTFVDLCVHRAVSSGRPLVVSSGLVFLPGWHYSDILVQKNLYYVADPQRAAAITGRDSMDKTLVRFARLTDVRIVDYRTLLERSRQFYLLAGDEMFEWMRMQLIREGCNLRLLDLSDTYGLYTVDCSHAGPVVESAK